MKKKESRLLSLLTVGVISLSLIAPLPAYAAEEGENSAETSSISEVGELAPAIAMTAEGEIIYSPEEMPEDLPEPEPEPVPGIIEDPIIDGFENFKAMFSGMRYLYPEMSLEEYAQTYIDELTQYTTDPERIDYENRWVWTAATELYPEEVANEVSTEKWQYYDPEKLGRPFALNIGEFHNDYAVGEDQEVEEWVEIAEPVTYEFGDYTITIHHMGKVDTDEQGNADIVEDSQSDAENSDPAEDPGPIPNGFIAGQYDQYTVAKGDSLWKIAERFWGDGEMWFFIYHANEEIISHPDRIHTGQELLIPFYFQG